MEDLTKWCAMIEAEASESRRLGTEMARFLTALAQFGDGCCVPVSLVARAATVSPRTGTEAIRRAVAMGYLVRVQGERVPQRRGSRAIPMRAPNRYHFVLPPTAVPSREAGLAWRKRWRAPTRRLCRGKRAIESINCERPDAGVARAALEAVRRRRVEALGVSG